MGVPLRTPFSRVFTIEDTAGPANVPVYQGQAKAQSPSWSLGDRTPIREPDPSRYGAFRIVDAIKGEKGLPTMSLEVRYKYTLSDFLRFARRGCPLDVQVHFGKCQDPKDFNFGWDKILVLEDADMSTWGASDLGALEQGEDAVVNEAVDFNALDMYELKPLLLAELGAAEIIAEVIAVSICDAITCGECGIPSDGCQRVFAITTVQAASPGLPAELIFSSDGGATLGETNIATLNVNFAPSGMACVGTRLVIISNDDDALHYAPIIDILNEEEIWVRVAAGFLAAGSPNAIFSLGSAQTWIVGDLGYVYFSSDITAGVTVQDAGIATGEVLLDIHGYDEDNLVAVGENNAVIRTIDGQTWVGVDGPAGAGIDLLAVWMKSALEWLVGDIQGQLWYTRDAGENWVEKVFPGSGTGAVRDIFFATPTVGYMAHNTDAPAGRILRTVDGGFSWYVLPEGTGMIPANDYISSLAASGECPNVVYGGGLAEVPPDGILVKGA